MRSIKKIIAASLSLAIVCGALPTFASSDGVSSNITAYAANENKMSDIISGSSFAVSKNSVFLNDTDDTLYCGYDEGNSLVICDDMIMARQYSDFAEVKSGDTLTIVRDIAGTAAVFGQLKKNTFYCTAQTVPSGFIGHIPSKVEELYFTQAEEIQEHSLSDTVNNRLNIYFSAALEKIDSYAFENSGFCSVYFKNFPDEISEEAFLDASGIVFYYPGLNQDWIDFINSNNLISSGAPFYFYDMQCCSIEDNDGWVSGFYDFTYWYDSLLNTTPYDIYLLDLGSKAVLFYDRLIVEKYKDQVIPLPEGEEVKLKDGGYSEIVFLIGSLDGEDFYYSNYEVIPELFEFLPSGTKNINFCNPNSVIMSDYSFAGINRPDIGLIFPYPQSIFGKYVFAGSSFGKIDFTKFNNVYLSENTFSDAGKMDIYYPPGEYDWISYRCSGADTGDITWHPESVVYGTDIQMLGASAKIDQKIGMDYYVEIPGIVKDSIKFTASVNGGETYEIEPKFLYGETYCLSIGGISPKDAANPIVINVLDKSNNDAPFRSPITTSPRDYILALRNNAEKYPSDYPQATVELADSLLIYCDAVEKYFGLDSTTDMNIDDIELWRGMNADDILYDYEIANAATKPTGYPQGWHYYGTTLLLKSDITLREYFTVDKGTDTSKFDGQNANPDYYYVERKGINPTEFDSVSLYGLTVNSYIKSVLSNNEASDELKAVCTALFNYHIYSELYN